MKLGRMMAVAVLAAAGGAGTAWADTVDITTPLDQLPSGTYVNFMPVSGTFSDLYNFSISTLSSSSVSLTNVVLMNEQTAVLNIQDATVTLDGPSGYHDVLAGFTTSFMLPGTPGDYHALVEGHGTGLGGQGAYVFSAFAQPVPLPPAVWLMGAGLVGLAGIGGRRRGK